MKCVAGHQPNLYPYPGFFAKIATADLFVIVDNVQYVKKEYHNRNKIKFSDSSAKWITIPVKNSGRYKQLINEAEIDYSTDWRKSHLRTFELNYKKAKFFKEYFSILKKLLTSEWIKNADFNIEFIKITCEYLRIKTPILVASELGIKGESSYLIADICKKTSSDTYLHGIHSLDYVDFTYLEKNNIKSLIQIFECPQYPQLHGDFIPNLSIIDTIMNCGAEKTLSILREGMTIFNKTQAEEYLRKKV